MGVKGGIHAHARAHGCTCSRNAPTSMAQTLMRTHMHMHVHTSTVHLLLHKNAAHQLQGWKRPSIRTPTAPVHRASQHNHTTTPRQVVAQTLTQLSSGRPPAPPANTKKGAGTPTGMEMEGQSGCRRITLNVRTSSTRGRGPGTGEPQLPEVAVTGPPSGPKPRRPRAPDGWRHACTTPGKYVYTALGPAATVAGTGDT